MEAASVTLADCSENDTKDVDLSKIDYDLTSCGRSLDLCTDALNALRECIEFRLNEVFVKFHPEIVIAMADYVSSSWSYYCETSLDLLLFKAPQSVKKGILSMRLGSQLDAWGGPNSCTSLDAILNVGEVRRAPYVAFDSGHNNLLNPSNFIF